MYSPGTDLHATEDSAAHRAVLLVAYWYPPENESGALRPARFTKYLPRYGFRAHILSAPLSSGRELARNVHRTAVLAPRGWRALLDQTLLRLAPYNDRLEWIAPARETARGLLSQLDIAAIVSTAPPLACHLIAWRLAKRYQLPWIADFRDPLVGNPFRTRRLGRLYDRIIEGGIVVRADAVVVNTDAAFAAFGQRYPAARHKFHLIWNGYDPQDDLQAAPIAPRGYKLLAHFGALYGARHPGIVLHSLERLIRGSRADPTAVRVRLVGSIDHSEPWLESSAFSFLRERHCLEYTDCTVPRDQATEEMTRADYLLLLDLNELAAGVQVPAKLFEYVRVGRPVLALTTRNSPVERILARAQTPHVCIYVDDSEAEVDRKLQGFLAFPSAPVAPSEWFRERFDSVAQTSLLAALIESNTRSPLKDARVASAARDQSMTQ
jgi:glycosyltransferase involved in cell wall biosynthesis